MGQNGNPPVWPVGTRSRDNVSRDCATPECLQYQIGDVPQLHQIYQT